MTSLSHTPAPDHLPVEIARALLHFRACLLERFPGQIRSLILYGSFARGNAHAESDVDVMVVVTWEGEQLRSGRAEISDLSVDVMLEWGRYISPFVINERRFHQGSDVAVEARREGFELLSARLVHDRLEATRVGDEAEPLRQLKETDEPYAADEPADLDNPRTWLELAYDKMPAARVLLDAKCYDDVISKAYYAMLYAAKAALLTEGVKVRTPHGAVMEFGRMFVATGRVDKRYAAIFGRSLDGRIHNDYEPDRHTRKDEAEAAVAQAESFIATAHKLVETRI